MSTETLRKIPLFCTLPDESLAQLAEMGTEMVLAAGEIVYRQGDKTDGMYAVLQGRLRVYMSDETGNETELSALGPGDFFGEMASLDDMLRSATVECVTECRLFKLDDRSFMRLLLLPDSQLVVLSILNTLVRRGRATMQKYFDQELARRTLHAQMEAQRHRALAQLVAGVAHELNTPLGITNTAVNMIEQRVNRSAVVRVLNQSEETRSILEEILEAADLAKRNIQRAARLVQSFKKLSVDQLTDTHETVDLPDAVRDTVELFTINARRANLQIEINDTLPPDHKQWVGYPGYLGQVLMNLLFNVERYAYPGETGGRIEIGIGATSQQQVPSFVVTVEDYGKGIAPEHLSQVFTPFFTTGRATGGTGLGLAIVHSIVTGPLQGTIEIESQLGKGTLVRVTFPQAIPAPSTTDSEMRMEEAAPRQ